MSEFQQPQQTPENTFQLPINVNPLLAKAGCILAFVAGPTLMANKSAEAQDAPYQTDVWGILSTEQQKAIEENKDMTYIGPSESQLRYSVSSAATYSGLDELRKVTIRRTKNLSKFAVKLNLQNRRGQIPVAIFKNSQPEEETKLKKVGVSLDGNLFTRETITVTPMLKAKRKGSKPRKWGRSVKINNGDIANSSEIYKVLINSEDSADEARTKSITVKSKPISRAILKAGRFYIDVDRACVLNDRTYDPKNESCSRAFGASYRVGKKKSTSYVPGRQSKPGAVLVHTRRVR